MSNDGRLLFWGTRGTFSRVVLETLLARAAPVIGVVVPGDGPLSPLVPPPPLLTELPLVPSFVTPSVVEVAWRQGLPVSEVGTLDAAALAAVREAAPAAIVVACWPRRLPDALLALPPWGCLNIHPSRLPDFRGPAPLFWQRRAGLSQIGVTVHRMSPELDRGDLLAQAPLPLPDGATGEALDQLTARHGAQLLLAALDALRAGTARFRPQPSGGSYQGWPQDEDFVVPTTWSARHAWNFMRAADQWHRPFTIPLPDGPLRVARPLRIAPRATLDAAAVAHDAGVAIRFSPGVLLVEPAHESRGR